MQPRLLSRSVKILLFLSLLFGGLYVARAFLIPLCFGALLAMLFLPVVRYLERKGVNKAVAALSGILILVAAATCIGLLLATQITDFARDADKIEQNVRKAIAQIQQNISRSLGLSTDQQKQLLQSQTGSAGTQNSGGFVSGALSGILGILVDTVLVLVYIFLFTYMRHHLKRFALKLVPEEQQAHTLQVVHDGGRVAQKYLSGLACMIAVLWVLYGIGFSIVGVENALFFAVLCGLLEIVPFVGNLTGTTLTVLMAVSQGGGTPMIIGILITYGLVQFIQTYILEPLVVGSNVNINPLFTILVLVLGERVWGIPGMILAIPLLGITKIICDHIEPLKPYGYLMGEERPNNTGIIDKIKQWLHIRKD